MDAELLYKDYKINLKKSARAKYLKLSVNRFGEVKLTAPGRIAEYHITNFLEQHEPWLANVLSKFPKVQKIQLLAGNTLNILGQSYQVEIQTQKSSETRCYISETDAKIFFFRNETTMDSELRKLLVKKLVEFARKHTSAATREYALKAGVNFQKISIREQITRWGSCSSQGNLNYNWKIVLAPRDIFEYVIAHEVAHLAEHNHSSKFWSFLENIYPQYRSARIWLKRNSHLLEII